MGEKKEIVPPKYDLDAKWDACLDLTVRRFVYSSLAGAFGGLLLFRTPVTRWASVAFGAGAGIGSAYTDCSRLFDGSSAKLTAPKNTETPTPKNTETPAPKTTETPAPIITETPAPTIRETPAPQEAGTEN